MNAFKLYVYILTGNRRALVGYICVDYDIVHFRTLARRHS